MRYALALDKVCRGDRVGSMNITTYDEAEALIRRLNDEECEPTVFTDELRRGWELIAETEYADTERCDNSDLRIAFVYGAMAGYSLLTPFGAPTAFDRMQGDAFIAGVQEGERQYALDGWLDDDDDDDEVIVTDGYLAECYG